MNKLIFLILLIISFWCNSQSLQFYREDIIFTVKSEHFYVNGIYNFCNNGDAKIKKILFYPFPNEISPETIDSVFAYDLVNQNTSVLLKTNSKGAFFEVNINAYGTGKYNVGYRQKILGNKIEYILLTTKEWGIPFDNALYKLIIPNACKVKSLSYKADSVNLIDNNYIYYWNKTDFMPEKNFVIELRDCKTTN